MLHYETINLETNELLKDLMRMPVLKDFALVGGTNLSLRYGHRISVDIDLFTNLPFDADEIIESIFRIFPNTVLIGKKKYSIWLIINGIKVDFILHEYPYLEGIEIIDGVRFLSVQDIIPMKLQALAGRGVKKDFWDIYELLFHFDLSQMKDFHDRKYLNSDFGFVLLSMSYFEDAEHQQQDPIDLKGITWNDVKIRISSAAKVFINQRVS